MWERFPEEPYTGNRFIASEFTFRSGTLFARSNAEKVTVEKIQLCRGGNVSEPDEGLDIAVV